MLRASIAAVIVASICADGASAGVSHRGKPGKSPVSARVTKAPAARLAARVRPEIVLQVGHFRSVNAIAFSPDGTRLATGSWDGTVNLWDTRTETIVRTLQEPVVKALDFSPDSQVLAVGSGRDGQDDTAGEGSVTLYQSQTGQLLRRLVLRGEAVESVVFLRDGHTLAGVGTQHTLYRWDFPTGRLTSQVRYAPESSSVVVSPDGLRWACVAGDAKAAIHDARSGALERTIGDGVRQVRFSPDGRTVVTAGRELELWDVESGRLRTTLGDSTSASGGFLDGAWSPTFSPDGRLVAAISGTFADVWRADTGRRLPDLPGHSDTITALAFSANGTQLATGGRDRFVHFWDIGTRAYRKSLPARRASVRAVAFSPDGRLLASGADDRGVRLWDARAGHLRRVLAGADHGEEVATVAFSPDGKALASGSTNYDGMSGNLRLWSAADGRLLRTIGPRGGGVRSCAFFPDGGRIATASGWDDGEAGSFGDLVLWDTDTGKELQVLAGHYNEPAEVGQGSFAAVAVSPNGGALATLTGQGGSLWLELWDLRTGTCKCDRRTPASAIAYSPDGRLLAVGRWQASDLCEPATGRRIRSLAGYREEVSAVAFAPRGRFVAGVDGASGTVKLWVTATGKLHRTLAGNSTGVSSVAFSPDGKRIATGSYDNTIRLWDVETSRLLAMLMVLPTGSEDPSAGWLAYIPEGYCVGSPGAQDFVAGWRVGDRLIPMEQYQRVLWRPDLVAAAVQGRHVPAPRLPQPKGPSRR